MAMLYQRGRIWWVKYYVNGAPRRESTGTEKQEEARDFLRLREGAVGKGAPVPPRLDRILYEEVAEDLRRHYRTTGDRDQEEAEGRLKHLDRFFAARKIATIGPADVTKYVEHRQAQKTHLKRATSNATINREVSVLSRMLRLAYENEKLLRLPVIRRLKENGPRQGFFEREQYGAVCRRLRPDLQVAVAVAYTFGWRMQDEVLTLERRQVDLEVGTLRLEPGTTKNDEGRLVYLAAELEIALREQVARVQALERQAGRIIPWLFPHLTGLWRGERIQDFRKAWRTACKKAGVPGRLRHDLRRTAVRNMVNAGIPERVAMTVTGHKTRKVFDRYHIVSPGDLQEVARKLTGTISGTVGRISLEAVR